jgi:hypothetical protein
MTAKTKRGGLRPNAGQPKKPGGYRRVNFSPSLPSIAIADRIKSEHGTTFTGAIELALKHYEKTKMKAKQKLEKLIEENVGLNNVTVEKRWNPVLSEDQYCITAADGVQRETFLGKTVKDAEDHIEKMEVSRLVIDQ